MLVGGCVRKLLNKEKIDDIDIAININPEEIRNILILEKINFLETGISHGTITIIINNLKFEVTTLRKDISTDGRHADVEFISDWEIDAKRRDFTINAIYSDLSGEIYDPVSGIQDLKDGVVKFIGDPNIRIKEDYLRILRYFRFYTQYSKHNHKEETIKAIKKNLEGLTKISKERIIDELSKILNLKDFYKLFENNASCSIILSILPQLKYYNRFKILPDISDKIISRLNIPLILSILLIDKSDNCDFFLYKFKFSNKDKEKILFLRDNYKKINFRELLNEKKLIKLSYSNGIISTIEMLIFLIFTSEEISISKVEKCISFLDNLILPVFPVTGDYLKSYHNFSEGKELGSAINKLKQHWIDNDFIIDKNKIENILKIK
jgi:poly(A) polymerase